MAANGSSMPSASPNSIAPRRSLWANPAAVRMAWTRPASSSEPNGATVRRNMSVEAPPIRASLALITWASLDSSMPAASANTWAS